MADPNTTYADRYYYDAYIRPTGQRVVKITVAIDYSKPTYTGD